MSKKKKSSLPETTEPLQLADGSVVMPDGKVVRPGKQEKTVEIPSHTEARNIVVATRRRLIDLPALPQQLNAISVVLTYSLFGLDEVDIAQATGLSVDQIARIKMHEAYGKMQEEVCEAVLTSDAASIRSVIAAHSRSAVQRIVDIARDGDDNTALSAAKDLLDRAGHRPVDIVEHRVKMEGGLTIEVRKRDDTDRTPVIDITPGVPSP